MHISRRGLAAGAVLAAAAAGLPQTAGAEPSTADNVIVYCDRALRRTMQQAGRLFAARGGGKGERLLRVSANDARADRAGHPK